MRMLALQDAERHTAALTLEATLAFVDGCTIDSDDEMDGEAEGAATSASGVAHTVRMSSGRSPLLQKEIDRLSEKSFFDAVNEFVNEEDCSDSEYVSMADALELLDACDVSVDEHPKGAATSGSKVIDVPTAAAVTAKASSGRTCKKQKATPRSRQIATKVPKPSQVLPKSKTTVKTKQPEEPQKPTKKRVRKQREELLYLRAKVGEMEALLANLQKSDATSGSPTNSASSPASMLDTEPSHNDTASVRVPTLLLQSVWERVAERQYKERERSEKENRKLKATLEEQIKLVKRLENMLTHEPDIEMLSTPKDQKRFKMDLDADAEDDSEILQELKAEVSEAYPIFEREYASSALKDMTENGGDIEVRNSPEQGMFVELTANKVVPHDLQVTKNAVWRFLSRDGIKRQCYYYHELEEITDDYSARDFGVKVETKQKNLDIHGKHVIKKIEEDRRLVILWSAVVNPIKFTGVPTNGMRFRERGWVVIQPSNNHTPTASSSSNKTTEIKTHITFTPDLDKSVETMAVGVVTDLVIDSVESNMHLFQEMIDELLLDEEWRSSLPVTV